MAQTGVQLEVEDWVRREWLPKEFGQRFTRERLGLTSGGVFDFDAVSADEKIVASISTSAARTARGNLAVGKLTKIRSERPPPQPFITQRTLLMATSICYEVPSSGDSRGSVCK
ncbi:MAG TPA: hypothetical protein VEW05_04110 [Candidatus Polarisedimenticolia bacterium]|nr:hypothetical protein [Candidatus Polarisedimenticolia bacterium]